MTSGFTSKGRTKDDVTADKSRGGKGGGKNSSATLEGYDTGTHISKGKGKTPKGELTTACKDRPGELGRLKSSCVRIETKESFDANITGYKHHGKVPRDDLKSYGKPKIEFSEAEKKEYELANWIKNRKKSLKSLQNRLEAYVAQDEVSEMLDDVRERVAKVTKTWEAKRKRD